MFDTYAIEFTADELALLRKMVFNPQLSIDFPTARVFAGLQTKIERATFDSTQDAEFHEVKAV